MDERTKEIEELKAAGKLVFCTKCGAPNSNDGAFCGECGAPLLVSKADASSTAHTYQYNSSTTANNSSGIGGEPDPRVIQMVAKNKEYYVPKFRILKATNKKASWNWPAFLVTPFWLFYRRMYLYGGIYLGATLVLTLLNMALLVLAADIAAGILGNYIYMTFLEKTLSDANMLQEPLRHEMIMSHTGTNTTAVWICVGAYVALLVLMVIIISSGIGLLYSLL